MEEAVFSAPVVGPEGVVYINDQAGHVYARLIEDGCEVWTVDLNDSVFSSPTLEGTEVLLTGRDNDLIRMDPWTGDRGWTFRTSRELFGTAILSGDRAYVASDDKNLYCIDVASGRELWRFDTRAITRGAVAEGHDGTIYVSNGPGDALFAVSPEGKRLWFFVAPGIISNAPIVDGNGTIYLTSTEWTGQVYIGRVHAVNPDGTAAWVKVMPDGTWASPMLAPDGTLYVVCRDKNLYAFRDVAGDLDHDGDIDLADLGTLGDCMTGPRIWGTRALTPPGCELLDFDRDWDVDVADFARIQIELSAP
jgi:outer membrane protein assembly factor BamB